MIFACAVGIGAAVVCRALLARWEKRSRRYTAFLLGPMDPSKVRDMLEVADERSSWASRLLRGRTVSRVERDIYPEIRRLRDDGDPHIHPDWP